jgi:CheY-like chemotaxis protein
VAVPKILVADDDKEMVKLLATMLRRAGYEVVVSVDGCQAMDAACKYQPDLLILDVNMPAGGGLSVQERCQNLPAMCNCPVVYVTGDKSDTIVDRAIELGAVGILYKPFDHDQMLHVVRRALKRRAEAIAHAMATI